MLRLLVVNGNDRDGRRRHAAATGSTSGEAYARVIREISPSAICTLACPADADATLPTGVRLASFDAMVVTGSSLKIADGSPAVARQIALMQAALADGLPVFGSCWGVHVAVVACGGDVGPCDVAAEYAFARGVRRTAAGRDHHLFSGRGASWDAPPIHSDVVLRAPPGSTVLACNDAVAVQSIEIASGLSAFWGTQYHPELDLDELAIMLGETADNVVAAGQASDVAAVKAFADQIRSLHGEPNNTAVRQHLQLGHDVIDAASRRSEIANFLLAVERDTIRASAA